MSTTSNGPGLEYKMFRVLLYVIMILSAFLCFARITDNQSDREIIPVLYRIADSIMTFLGFVISVAALAISARDGEG